MKDLKQVINAAVSVEQFRASEIYGSVNHSDLESKSVIENQRDDARLAGGEFDYWFGNFWALVKRDKNDDLEIVKDKRECLKKMLGLAKQAAYEWVQAAAMVSKATETLNNRTDYEEQE